ncbi:hypothetical protein HDV00_011812 [Rhizophlyctis rosea]|nr:hypothetical protein HDV00_011812 [Rhizophlyctis rosea]
MERSLVDFVVADAFLELLVPATDSLDPKDILSAPQRPNAFHDELLHFYLCFRPSQSASTVKVTPEQLSDMAKSSLELQVTLTIGDLSNPPAPHSGHTSSLSASHAQLSFQTPAAPPAAIHHRARSATTASTMGPPRSIVGPSPLNSTGSPSAAGLLASPTVTRRSTSLKNAGNPSLCAMRGLSHSLSASGIFGLGSRELLQEVLYSYTYEASGEANSPILATDGTFVLFPLRVPVDLPNERHPTRITLSVNVLSKPNKADAMTGEFCDPDEFDAPNLFASLENVESTLTIRVNAVTTGPNTATVSVGMENNIKDAVSFDIASVTVTMPNTVITGLEGAERFPALLKTVDELHMLHNVTLLDDPAPSAPVTLAQAKSAPASRHGSLASLGSFGSFANLNFLAKKRRLQITVRGTAAMKGLREQTIVSEWFCEMDFGDGLGAKGRGGLVAKHGRKMDKARVARGEEEERVDEEGIELSFSLITPAVLRKIFTVQAFVVNRSSRRRELTLIVPNIAKPKDVKFGPHIVSAHEDESAVHLSPTENYVELGLAPNTCQTVNLHFIAVKGHLHRIERVQILDRETNQKVELRDVLEVYINEPS